MWRTFRFDATFSIFDKPYLYALQYLRILCITTEMKKRYKKTAGITAPNNAPGLICGISQLLSIRISSRF